MKWQKGDGEPHLDQVILKRILRYSKRSGKFIWRVRSDVPKGWNTRYAGKEAGSSWAPTGLITYRVIRIFDYPFLAHRLAWLYVTGSWPAAQIDHRDMDGENNRWTNLRQATHAQNGANRGPSKRNKTGFKGVSICGKTGRFRATIGIGGQWTELGRFDTVEEASAAYAKEAARRAGEFARAS